ncbi:MULTISPECIES: hypothetical protein [Clostridia]|nr:MULTISPECIES: hypothetical protein [Clostridia]
MEKLINAIDEALSNAYKVLSCDHDTLYVFERETQKEFAIKVTEVE